MKRIIVASKNPVKISSIERAFCLMFPGEECSVEGISVLSGVADQPMTDEETYRGALNRVMRAAETAPDAEFWAGLEGGIEERNGEMEAFAWVVVRSKIGKIGRGRTATFFVPRVMRELIASGVEMGAAADRVFDESNSKQKQGTIGILTDGAMGRTDYYVAAALIALIPFKNPDLY